MKKLLLVTLLASLALFAACESKPSESAGEKPAGTEEAKPKEDTAKAPANDSAETPKAAVLAWVKAYEAKDIEGLKKRFSKSTLDTMEKGAKLADQSLDDQLKKFVDAAELPFKGAPEMRNEKIDGDKATIEVNAEGRWEETPLVKEDGIWKMAFDQMKKS